MNGMFYVFQSNLEVKTLKMTSVFRIKKNKKTQCYSFCLKSRTIHCVFFFLICYLVYSFIFEKSKPGHRDIK